MLKILRCPGVTPGSQVLEEDVGRSVEEDDKGFHELRGRYLCLASTGVDRSNIPRPAILGETAHPTAKGKQAIPEENASFDSMRQTIEDASSLKNTCVGNESCQDQDETDNEYRNIDKIVEILHDLHELIRNHVSGMEQNALGSNGGERRPSSYMVVLRLIIEALCPFFFTRSRDGSTSARN